MTLPDRFRSYLQRKGETAAREAGPTPDLRQEQFARGARVLQSELVATPAGWAWQRRRFVPRPPRGEWTLPLTPLPLSWLGAPATPEGIWLLDLETTGASGGSGQIAFLFGLAHILPDGLEIVQLGVPDLDQEPAAIRLLQSEAPDPVTLVTFNGKSFDLPCLNARLTVNGMPPWRPAAHIDVLHPARKIWSERVGSCTLRQLEAAVLGHVRSDDIDGAEAPWRYQQYLLTGDAEPLVAIWEHNAQDLTALAGLFRHLLLQLADGGLGAPAPDRYGLAHLLQQLGQAERAEAVWTDLTAAGDTTLAQRARHALGHALKKRSAWLAAQAQWEAVLAAAPDPEWGHLRQQLLARVELAKLMEHRHHDPAAALALTEEALALARRLEQLGLESGPRQPTSVPALLHRRRRLLARIARQGLT